jgi:hypothetical protein
MGKKRKDTRLEGWFLGTLREMLAIVDVDEGLREQVLNDAESMTIMRHICNDLRRWQRRVDDILGDTD